MISTIDGLSDKEVGSGASGEAVAAAERTLGVQFPKDYAVFLQTYGWARLICDELYGIGESVPLHLNVITNAIREREDFRPYMPEHLLPVLSDGAGNHYCLDVSQIASGACPVVFWDHDEGETQTPNTVGSSFSDWLVERVTEQE